MTLERATAIYGWWKLFESTCNVGTLGFVYVLEAANSGRIKFGFTHTEKTYHRRLADIRSMCASEVKVLRVVHASCALERELHAELSESRHHAEWYEPTDEVLVAVEALVNCHETARAA